MNQFGLGISYFVQKQSIKHQIAITIQNGNIDKDIAIVSATTPNIIWENENEEFSIAGNMYDIITQKQIAGKTVYYCINDKNETILIEKYIAIAKKMNEKEKKKGEETSKIFTNDYLLATQTIRSHFPIYIATRAFSPLNTKVLNAFTAIITPPPKG